MQVPLFVALVVCMVVGTARLVYLKRDGETLTAFAGVNGMLRVEGDELIRDNGVPYEVSRDSLMKVLAKANRGRR